MPRCELVLTSTGLSPPIRLEQPVLDNATRLSFAKQHQATKKHVGKHLFEIIKPKLRKYTYELHLKLNRINQPSSPGGL